MPTATKTADVFKLLKSMHALSTGEGTIEAEDSPAAVLASGWSNDLLYRREPDFVDGYELTTPSGHAITMRKMWEAYTEGENIALSGPTGSGKSTIAFHLLDEANESTRVKNRARYADNQKRLANDPKTPPEKLEPPLALPYPVEHLSCHAETRSAEILGDIDLVYDDSGNRRPVVRWGHVVRAWTMGATLIAEEIDMPDPGVWAGTHQFFDGRTESTTVFLNGVQHISRNKRFRLIATLNSLMKGENQEEYAGTQVQNTAWTNRFGYTVIVDYMKPTAEVSLVVRKTGLDKGVAEKMVAAANKSRESHKEAAVDAAISTRDILAWAREIAREEKRSGLTVKSPQHWQDVVVPSAYPTFISRQGSQATRDAYMTFLSLRSL